MGAYRYCLNCRHPMDAPGPVDAIVGVQRCPECNHEHACGEWDKRAALDPLMERLARLEAAAGITDTGEKA